MRGKINSDSIISYGVLFSILLSIYPISSSGITYGDLLLFFVLLLSLLGLKKQENIIKIILPLFLYVAMVVSLSSLHFILDIKDFTTGIFAVLRYLFYLLTVFIISKNGFNFNKAYKLYKFLAILIAIYVVLQFISYNIFGIILPINILGLKTFDSVYLADSISSYATIGKFYRPSGIFVEPAHYSGFQAPILYALFNNLIDNNKNNKFYSYFIMFSLFLTGSTLGIIIIIYCFVKPIILSLKENFIKTFLLIASFIVMFSIFFSTSYGKAIYNRTFSDASNGAINGRFGSVSIVFHNNNHKLIGNGLSSNESYLPSYPYLFLCFGYIGFIIFIISIILTYLKCNKMGREFLILFLFISVGTLSLFSTSIVLLFSLIYSNYGNNHIIEKKEEFI